MMCNPFQQGGESRCHADETTHRELDPLEAVQVGNAVIHAEGLSFLERVVQAGEGGLTVAAGPNGEKLNGGLLDFWGLTESANDSGQITYRLKSSSELAPTSKLKVNEPERVTERLTVQGDLRRVPNVDHGAVWRSVRENRFVIVSDGSERLGLDPALRTKVLAARIGDLALDIHKVPPRTRKRLDGAIAWWRRPDGSIVVKDYPEVAVTKRSFFAKPPVYPNELLTAKSKIFKRWMRAAVMLPPPEILGDSGSIRLAFLETGAKDEFGNIGKVVEHIHRDDEFMVGSFPQHVNCGGAETSLLVERPDSSRARPPQPEDFGRIAKLKLGVGDGVVSDDINLWHHVNDPTPPEDGSDPLRRSLILIYLKPSSHARLQKLYPSVAVA